MSFNAKSLTYESNEPAFLRKLKVQYGGTDSARHQQPLARPRKQRNSTEEDGDEPVYVHEADPHEPISKSEYDALMDDKVTEDQDGPFATAEEPSAQAGKACIPMGPSSEPDDVRAVMHKAPSKQQIAVIGAASKKRSAKVIGDGSIIDEAVGFAGKPESTKSQKPKKAKRQKLSFQDD